MTKLFGKMMDSRYDIVFSFETINEPKRNVLILEHLTGTKITVETEIAISSATEQNALTKVNRYFRLHDTLKIITIAPISDGELRNWPIEYFKELCRHMVAKWDVLILLLGTRTQKSALDTISSVNPEKIVNLAGELSLLESAAIVKRSVLFIGNDSGFTHVAKALGKKFIGIIGGGCYGLFFPYNETKNERLLFHQLDCFGCEWRCHLEKPYCVQNVTVDQVIQSSNQLLNS
ncbi:MAG: glycosyltransferase family 9 protein [Ignavibacteriales bacterium]|nr:glycosyltransferase family 9 protein [Ignavibacteriales bacterium]